MPTDTRGRGEAVRTGVDLQSISAFDRIDPSVWPSLRDRVFTDAERRYCERRGYPAQHYAVRWTAKEAFIKLVGRLEGFAYADVAIATSPTGPSLALSDDAAVRLRRSFGAAGPVSLDVSLSHDREADVAAAQVVGVRREGDDAR